MTLQIDENHFAVEAFADGIAEAIAAAGSDPYSRAQAATYGYIKTILAFSEIAWVNNHANWPPEIKDAIVVLIIADTFAGFPLPTSIPMTFQEGWEAVNDVPDQFGGGTKEEFWAELAERFPAHFTLDGNGELGVPEFISSPPSAPDYSELNQPLARGEAPVSIQDAQDLYGLAPTQGSPLVLDLDGDGVELTTFNAASTTTFFDLNADGFAEQTAWVHANDGLLVRDLNENGIIDDVNELFGSPSVDGFALLAELDSNGDLRIDSSDADWGDLLIWNDADGDAVTDNGELLTLGSQNIVSFDLLGVTPSTSTISGNAISHTSTFKYANGTTRAIADAWFVHDKVNSFYTGEYELDIRALVLPTLRGFGQLPDLHVAMSQNETLLDLVEAFAVGFDFDAFATPTTLNDDISDILYEWAGVSGVNPASRGSLIDARKLEFMEEFFGTEFLQWGTSPNPGFQAAGLLEESWAQILGYAKAHLVVQAGASALFDETPLYDTLSGELTGTLDLSAIAIDDLVDYATDTGVATYNYWVQIAEFIDRTKGLSNITGTEEGWLDTAIYDSGLTSDDWDNIATYYVNNGPVTSGTTFTGNSSNETINGTGADDNLTGGGGTDTINGGDGDDTIKSHTTTDTAGDTLNGGNGDDLIEGRDGADALNGGDGNDILKGGAGADTLNPGAGGDRAEGGSGNDTYIYTSGDHVYLDAGSSTDKIVLPSGIDSGDLTFHRLGNTGLLVQVGTLGTIQIENQINVASSTVIESIEFNDTTTLNLLAINAPETHGTNGYDALYGVSAGAGSDDDVIFGYGGNDQIYSEDGNNIVDGGDGNDYISLVNGDTDRVIASAGYDQVVASSSVSATLEIPVGYSAADITLFRPIWDEYALIIQIAGLGQVESTHQFVTGSIDEIDFAGAGASIILANTRIGSHGTSANNTINGITYGASENDIMYGYAGNDTLNGSSGNDDLYGGEGNDTLSGGQGDDIFYYDSGHDVCNEVSTGTDILDIAAAWNLANLSFRRNYAADSDDMIIEINGSNSIVLDKQLANTNGDWETLRMHDGSGDISFTTILVQTQGSSSGETIQGITVGASTTDTIYANGGNDTVHAGNGSDSVYGGDGSDTLNGESGNDVLYGDGGNDTLNGGNDNDTMDGGSGDDTLDGSGGNDTYLFASGLDTITDGAGTDTLWITGGTTINDITFSNVSSFHTKITVSTGVNEVTVNGLRNPFPTNHVETVQFDDGFTANLPSYASWLNGTSGADTVSGNGSDNVLIGFAGNDTINAGSGNDNAHGGSDNDTIHGDGGTDLLHGGTGNDILYGDDGLDTLYGGSGADTFMLEATEAFANVDVVKDFNVANDNDVLDISDILDATAYNHGVDLITNWVEITTSGSDSVVKIDRDGTGGTYTMTQVATLQGITGLTDEAALVTSGNLLAA